MADEVNQRQRLLAKNHGQPIVENYRVDSLPRTIEIDYRIPTGWQGQATYQKSFTIYGRHRTITFWFSGPDNPLSRQQFDASQASVLINPVYLQAIAKPHSEYKD
ncbi:MAG: hypothetical protein ACRYFX_26210 [Janthinobacterium lividum]